MNWLDFLIIGVVSWFTLTAYLSGFIRETVRLGAVVLGVVLAGLFHDRLATDLELFTDASAEIKVASFLTIFVVVAVAGWVLAWLLHSTVELFFLGWADRTAGAVFGFLKGVLVIQAVTVIFVLQPAFGAEDVIAASAIGSFFLDSTPVVRALLPGEFDHALTDFFAA